MIVLIKNDHKNHSYQHSIYIPGVLTDSAHASFLDEVRNELIIPATNYWLTDGDSF